MIKALWAEILVTAQNPSWAKYHPVFLMYSAPCVVPNIKSSDSLSHIL